MSKMKSLKDVEEEDADGCECFAQWALLIANVPLLVLGVVLLALGAWTLAERDFLEALQPRNGSLFAALAIVVLVVGGLLLVLSVFGCVAAFLENKRVLMAYYVGALVVFLLLCVAVAMGFAYRMKVTSALRSESVLITEGIRRLGFHLFAFLRLELSESVSAYDPDRRDAAATKAWDTMQRRLQCCGVAVSDAADAAPPYTVWRNNIRLNSGEADSR